jgi:hypothetical protein
VNQWLAILTTMTMSFFLCALALAVVALAQPQIYSRFTLDGEKGGSTLMGVGPLAATASGFSFVDGVARSGPEPVSISLDWSGQSGFEFGCYVSVWLRFAVQNARLVNASLLTTQTVNITTAFNATDNAASFTAYFTRNGMPSSKQLSVPGLGAIWRRLTVGYCGNTYYIRVYALDGGGVADEKPQATTSPTSVPSSNSLVLGGAVYPQIIELKDLVLFRPRSAIELMTEAWDEQVARHYNPNAVSIQPTTTTITSMATTPETIGGTSAPPNLSSSIGSTSLLASTATASIISGESTSSLAVMTDDETTHKSGDDGLLIGGAIGGALVLIAILAIVVTVVWRQRRRQIQPSRLANYGVVPPAACAEYSDVGDVRSRSVYEAASSKLEA